MTHSENAVRLFYEARNNALTGNASKTRECLIAAAEEAAQSVKTGETTGAAGNKIGEFVKFILSACREIRNNGLSGEAMSMLGIAGAEKNTEQGEWFADMFDRKKSAVGRIHTRSGSGTGFVISDKGYMLTNCHVVDDSLNLDISIDMGTSGKKLRVLKTDPVADLALCKLTSPYKGEVISLAIESPKPGQSVMVIGNAFNLGLMPSTGVIRLEDKLSGKLIFSAETNPGDSGGPVLNKHGQCVGVNASRTVALNGSEARGFVNAVSIYKVKSLLERWGVTL